MSGEAKHYPDVYFHSLWMLLLTPLFERKYHGASERIKKADPAFYIYPPFADSNKAQFYLLSALLARSYLNRF